ncbi:hypothetical protein AA313_de0209349 [Arthrobotrys entomopaga]|nr:hypothetical protein AA313_de0209349 [Arthrobotrys entomopaga]
MFYSAILYCRSKSVIIFKKKRKEKKKPHLLFFFFKKISTKGLSKEHFERNFLLSPGIIPAPNLKRITAHFSRLLAESGAPDPMGGRWWARPDEVDESAGSATAST